MSELVPCVLRFRDGRVVRVRLPDGATPSPVVAATGETGEPFELRLDTLKGLFYLKQPKDRLLEVDAAMPPVAGGMTARVVFEDDEILTGRVGSFDGSQPGFFLFPIDPASNNAKIYVVTAAVRSLELRP